MANNKVFDLYELCVNLGKFEVEHSRIRFYENSKLHILIGGTILALDSFALSKGPDTILLLGVIVAISGFMLANSWKKQINASSFWESKWYSFAAKIEEKDSFKSILNDDQLKIFSSEDIKDKLDFEERKQGSTSKMYITAANSMITIYIILGLASMVFYVIPCVI